MYRKIWITACATLVLFLFARSASMAGSRTVTISCPVVTADFFVLLEGENCTGMPARTYWVSLATDDGSPIAGPLATALTGKPVNMTCTLSSMASDFGAFNWQQNPGGFYGGTLHAAGQPTATFVNSLASLIVVNGKATSVSATCILYASGLAGIPFNIKNLFLHFD